MTDDGAQSRPGMLPIQPEAWAAPRGYSNGMLAPASGRLLFVAGQVGWDADKRLIPGGFVAQFGQALANVVAVVEAAGGRPENLGRLTIYVTDRTAYLDEIKAVGEAYRAVMSRHFPAMALVEVSALVEAGAEVEIEGTAVIPASETT